MLTDKKFLGKYLKKKRIESKLRQIDVATHLGYSTAQFISNWERGTASPPLPVLVELVTLYGVSKREFVALLLEEQTNALNKLFGVSNKNRKAR